jgi:hypothetical protein
LLQSGLQSLFSVDLSLKLIASSLEVVDHLLLLSELAQDVLRRLLLLQAHELSLLLLNLGLELGDQRRLRLRLLLLKKTFEADQFLRHDVGVLLHVLQDEAGLRICTIRDNLR